MTLEQIIKRRNNPPKLAKHLEALLKDTKFEFCKGSSTREAPHKIISLYGNRRKEFVCPTIGQAYSLIYNLAVELNDAPSLTISNLYNGANRLNYEQLCACLNIDKNERRSAIVWQNINRLTDSLNEFTIEELEQIARGFNKIIKVKLD